MDVGNTLWRDFKRDQRGLTLNGTALVGNPTNTDPRDHGFCGEPDIKWQRVCGLRQRHWRRNVLQGYL